MNKIGKIMLEVFLIIIFIVPTFVAPETVSAKTLADLKAELAAEQAEYEATQNAKALTEAQMSQVNKDIINTITSVESIWFPYMNNGINFLGLGNLEGKEARFGSGLSSLWTAITTSASSGSVNSMLDSYTPLGGMFAMLMIQLGEVIFGGVGSGLYGLVAFSIITVFIAGLMVGRTPEFLEKKIEPKEMKWAMIVALATPLSILLGSGIAALGFVDVSSIQSGPHGFSQLLYAFTSAGGNNGSAFAGFNANTTFLNISLALCMLFSRFTPIIGVLAFSGSLSVKKKNAVTSGTLQSDDFMFGFLLVFIILVIGALSFFPALSLGPIAEFLGRGI